jgi:nucleotide-binding universal stress UspA family protein
MLIAHATDLTGDDDAAFVHATALAVAARARLVTVHGNPGATAASALPDAAALASRWGHTLAHERRCHDCCEDVAETVLDALQPLGADLIVVGTHARRGLSALMHTSIGETIARNLGRPVLVIPNRVRGFVDRATGAIDLGRVVIPAASQLELDRGIEAARSLVAMLHLPPPALDAVHVGDDGADIQHPGGSVIRTHGTLEDVIVSVARERQACLIVMPTRAHDGIGDVLLGSHTERVIRESSCPVLAVPFAAA